MKVNENDFIETKSQNFSPTKSLLKEIVKRDFFRKKENDLNRKH